MKKIFITGGHLTPAQAVIDELKKKKWEIYYLGRKTSLEGDESLSTEFATLSHSVKVNFLTIYTGRLQRSFTKNSIPSLLKIPIGFFQSVIWVLKYQPQAILSFGSYVGVPPVVVGWLLGIPVVVHEQTIVPSLSSKLITPFARKILVSWASMLSHYPKEKAVLTGNPIRAETFQINKTEKYSRFIDIKNKTKLPVVYITGGNQGSHSINIVVKEALQALLKNHLVIHQCGSSKQYQDFATLSTHANSLGQDFAQRYFPFEFIDSKDIGWVYKEADIVVGRSGANTISEIAALGKLAILIPLPWSGGGEAQRNAEMLNEAGQTAIIEQKNLTAQSLLSKLEEVQKNPDLQKNAQQLKNLINLDAAAKIVSEVEKVVN